MSFFEEQKSIAYDEIRMYSYTVKSGSKDHGLINIFMAKTMVAKCPGVSSSWSTLQRYSPSE